MVRTYLGILCPAEILVLMGVMAAIPLSAQQSAPSVAVWTGVVRTAAGQPVFGARVVVTTTAAAEQRRSAVTGTEGKFAIAGLAQGRHAVTVELPGRDPT